MYKTIINYKDGLRDEVFTKGHASVKREDYDYIIVDERGVERIIINDDEVKNIKVNFEKVEENHVDLPECDQVEAVSFIWNEINDVARSKRVLIEDVLNAYEDYMRSKGMVKD